MNNYRDGNENQPPAGQSAWVLLLWLGLPLLLLLVVAYFVYAQIRSTSILNLVTTIPEPSTTMVACVESDSHPLADVSKYNLNAVKMVSPTPTLGWVVGEASSFDVLLYYTNGTWLDVSNTKQPRNDLRSLDMASPDEGWAGGRGVLLHYKDGCWGGMVQLYAFASHSGMAPLESIDMVSPNEGWAVGSGRIVHYRAGGWIAEDSPVGQKTLQSVSMQSQTEGWAVGEGLVHFDGRSWVVVDKNSFAASISMISAEEGWATSTPGKMLHYANKGWRQEAVPTTEELHGIHMLSADEGWAVGGDINPVTHSSVILHYQNRVWSVVESPTNRALNSIYMLSPNEGWAVGLGVILHYVDGSWQNELSSANR